ncbi:MAG: prolyl oligopeptidase family serine peptidase [Mesorhizobium sp.]
MGDYATEQGRSFLEERSPLNHVSRVVRPLLIRQGANDVREKPSESEQIVAAMQQHSIPVTYVFYSDEGHGLGRPENGTSLAAVVEHFWPHIWADAANPWAMTSRSPRSNSGLAAT